MRKAERHQIKRDDLATLFERAAAYVDENVRTVSLAATAGAVLLVSGLSVRAWVSSRAERSSVLVGQMIQAFRAPVGAAAPEAEQTPASPAFSSLEERDRKVLAMAEEILSDGALSGAAPKALYYKGLALANLKSYDEAVGAMELFLRKYSRDFLAPMVRFELARVREAQGRPADALVQFQALAEGSAGPFPREEGLLGVARCQEAMGQKAEALKVYKRILSDFPESEYHSEARGRIADLS